MNTIPTEAYISRADHIREHIIAQNDIAVLNTVESVLHRDQIASAITQLWTERDFCNPRMLVYLAPFTELIVHSPTSVASKMQLIEMLTYNTPALEKSVFATSFRSTIDEIVPCEFVSNDTYKDIKQHIFFASAFRGKGIGPGEFAFALLGRNGNKVDVHGDIVIDGCGIELKDGKRGSIKPGEVANSFRSADKAAIMLADQLDIVLDATYHHKFTFSVDNEFVNALKSVSETERQRLLTEWANTLYVGLTESNRNQIVSGLLRDMGSKAANSHFGPPMLAAYKEKDGWDSIMFVHENGNVVNVVDPIDSAELLVFQPRLRRMGDTQALPDGYINALIPKQ